LGESRSFENGKTIISSMFVKSLKVIKWSNKRGMKWDILVLEETGINDHRPDFKTSYFNSKINPPSYQQTSADKNAKGNPPSL
jgi:hypothetical protein